jgi:hypothetical protein
MVLGDQGLKDQVITGYTISWLENFILWYGSVIGSDSARKVYKQFQYTKMLFRAEGNTWLIGRVIGRRHRSFLPELLLRWCAISKGGFSLICHNKISKRTHRTFGSNCPDTTRCLRTNCKSP